MFLPSFPSLSALLVAEMRAQNATALISAAAESAERHERYVARSIRNRRWSVVSGEATATAAQAASVRVLERKADRILRSSEQRVSNDEYRANRLPRIAAGMTSRKGRPANPDVAEQFVSSFGSQFPVAQRLAAAFLPEKISQKDAVAVVSRLAGERGFTFDPTDKGDMSALREAMRIANPGSGRAGGRPRKVRASVVDPSVVASVPPAVGVLAGTYDAGLIGMLVGNLPQKFEGCTCAGLSGSGYRGCAGHGYGRSVTAHPYVGYSKPDGTVVHVGDLAQDDEQEGEE